LIGKLAVMPSTGCLEHAAAAAAAAAAVAVAMSGKLLIITVGLSAADERVNNR